jgi:HEAT repeat protein
MIHDLFYENKPLSAHVLALKDADLGVRGQAVDTLIQICGALTSLLPTLVSVLRQSDACTRARTATILGDFGSQTLNIVPVLRSALRTAVLTSDDSDVRFAASQALVQIGPHARSPVPVLIDNLRDELPSIRWNSANALAELGHQATEALPTLTSIALNDAVMRVRTEAAVAIWRIDRREQRVVPVLMEALADPDELVRWTAADCLGDIGSAAREALPALEAALSLPYKTRLMKMGVSLAIERIESAAVPTNA